MPEENLFRKASAPGPPRALRLDVCLIKALVQTQLRKNKFKEESGTPTPPGVQVLESYQVSGYYNALKAADFS